MSKNSSSSVVREGAFNDLAGVNAGPVNAAVKEDFERQHPVLGIEKNHTENFMLLLYKQQF